MQPTMQTAGDTGTLLKELALPPGVDLRGWMEGLDVLIAFESPMLAVFTLATQVPPLGFRV